MKKITRYAIIGFSIMVLLNLFYFGRGIYIYTEFPDYSLVYVVGSLLRTIALGLILLFFYGLYSKQK